MKQVLLACGALVALVCAAVTTAAHPSAVSSRRGDAMGMGFLDVSSEPTGASILIDDADVGEKTPQHHLAVSPGHHRLTLVAAGGGRKLTVGFRVESGQTKKMTLYLAK